LVRDLVIPILKAFRIEVVTGERPYGCPVRDVVLKHIRSCDALFVFTTQRDQLANQYWGTHHCVMHELAAALAAGVVTLRSESIRSPADSDAKEDRLCS